MKKITNIILASAIAATTLAPAKADAGNIFKSTVGVITGVPIGFFAGAARGATVKGVEYADSFSQELGDEPIGNIIGVPVGLFVGEILGGVTGMVNGVITGVKVGLDDPLTNENYSLDGEFMDYNPYDFDS